MTSYVSAPGKLYLRPQRVRASGKPQAAEVTLSEAAELRQRCSVQISPLSPGQHIHRASITLSLITAAGGGTMLHRCARCWSIVPIRYEASTLQGKAKGKKSSEFSFEDTFMIVVDGVHTATSFTSAGDRNIDTTRVWKIIKCKTDVIIPNTDVIILIVVFIGAISNTKSSASSGSSSCSSCSTRKSL